MFDKLKIHARHGIESPICERWLKFCDGHEVHIHKDYNKWHDAGTYIADLVANNKGIVVNCDIDCFVMDWGIVRAIIKHMKINGIGYAGVRDDAATIPHRGNSREVMNPFFNIFDCDIMKVPYGWERLPFVHEPFDELFKGMRRENKYLTFSAKQGDDGISTELSFNGKVFCVHTWYAREYEHDELQRERINKIIERCEGLL